MRFLIILFILFFSNLTYSNINPSYRKCLVLPLVNYDKNSQDFHNSIVKYIQSADWCISNSTNILVDILNKYNSSLDEFIKDYVFRKKVISKTNAETLIFFRANEKNSLEIWDSNGLLFKREFVDDFNLDDSIKYFEEYKKNIPYEGVVDSLEKDVAIVDGGTRFGFDIGDKAIFYKKINSVFHPKLGDFIYYNLEKTCEGEVLMSNLNRSYIKPAKKCYLEIKNGDHVKLVDLINSHPNKIEKLKKKNFIDTSVGFGISYFNLNIGGEVINKFTGPKFSLDIDFDLLLTRNIVLGLEVGGLYSILSGDNSNLSLLNTFGNNWGSYVSYRYWLDNFSKNSFIDFSLGYNSNFFGFNSSQEDMVSGQKYYGMMLRSNILLQLFNINFFGGLSFLPTANFSQEIQYIENINSVTGYELSLGAFFDFFKYQNLFSKLKISKFKAASTSNNLETSVQDIGIIVGYQFRL